MFAEVKKLLLSISFVLIIITSLFAQKTSKEVMIRGKVLDDQRMEVPYAAVVLFNSSDSSMVNGTATDDKGVFEMRASKGNYYIKISFLSLKEKVQSVTVGESNIDLGEIKMQKAALNMEEVVIEEQKAVMEMTLDKRVYNLEKDMSNIGKNAADVLDNVPSVTVDMDGNVNLRGSQNVRILVDGKPSGILRNGDIDALRSLNGDLIEKIEVITNPSARYDAEGEVGIINIVLKKNKKEGVNGTITAFTGYPDNHGFSFNLNWRKKYLNLFANYNTTYRKSPGRGYTYREVYLQDTTNIFETDRKHVRGGWSNNVRLGTDLIVNDMNTITVWGAMRYSLGKNYAEIFYTDYNELGNVLQVSERTDQEKENTNSLEGAMTYRKLFTQKGREFTIDLKYSDSKDLENSDYLQEVLYSPIEPINQRSSNTENESNFLFQSDYIHPFAKDGKFEAGVKSTQRVIENNYGVEQLYGSNWEPLSTFVNDMVYTEKIHAAYMIAGNKMKKISYQLGLRGEYSDITTDLKLTEEVNHRLYSNLFPSAHFTYDLKKKNAIQWSYSRRINRPQFRELLPFFGFSDSRSFFSGNPNVNPEYVNSLELGHMKYWDQGSLLSSVYYRYKTGVIQRITVVDSTGFTRIFPINLSTENDYGFELTFSKDVKKKLRLNGNFNFYRAISTGSYQGVDYSADTYTWNSRFTAKTKLVYKIDYQLSVIYRGPRNTAQGKQLSMTSIDMGLSKDLFKNKATLTFNVSDLLNSRKRRSITQGDNFYSTGYFQWRKRQFTLNFSYKLNQKQGKGNQRERGEGFEGGDDGF